MSNRRSIAMAANHQAMSTEIRAYGVARRDARLRNLEAKLEQLAMDARRIPQTSIKIRLTHARCSRIYKSSRCFEIFPCRPGSLLALEVSD